LFLNKFIDELIVNIYIFRPLMIRENRSKVYDKFVIKEKHIYVN